MRRFGAGLVSRAASPWGLALVLIGWSIGVGVLRRGHTGDGMDDGLYVASAQALRDGLGYVLPSQPGPPIRSRYPIGLPAMVALALSASPGRPSLARDVAVARGVILVAAWVFLVASFVWLRRRRVPPAMAFLIVLATAFNPFVTGISIIVMSDVPFAAIAMVLLARWAGRAGGAGRSSMSAFGDGLIAGLGFVVRGNGLALILGALAAAARGARPTRAVPACLLGAALVVAPLTAYSRMATGTRVSGGYGQEFAAGWRSAEAGLGVLGMNLRGVAAYLPDVVLPLVRARALTAPPYLAWAARLAIDATILLGAARLFQRSARRDLPTWAVVATTFAIFLVWPWEFSPRFVLALFPLILLAFAVGAMTAGRLAGLRPRAARRLAMAALAMAVVANGALMVKLVWNRLMRGETDGAVLARADALDFIRDRLEPDAIVVTMTPEMVYLHTGRQGVLLLPEEDRIAGRFGRRDRLASWMALTPGRPYYFLSGTPRPNADVDTKQVAAYASDPGIAVRNVYRTRDGSLQIDAVSLKGD